MTQLMEHKNTYLSSFAQLQDEVGGGSHPWLERLRKNAIERFAAVGFPSVKDEQWLHTNVAPIDRTPFRPAARPTDVPRNALAEFSFADDAAIELVFV